MLVSVWVGVVLIPLAAPTVWGLICFVWTQLWCSGILLVFDHFSCNILYSHTSFLLLSWRSFHFKGSHSSCSIKSMSTLRRERLLLSVTLTLFYILIQRFYVLLEHLRVLKLSIWCNPVMGDKGNGVVLNPGLIIPLCYYRQIAEGKGQVFSWLNVSWWPLSRLNQPAVAQWSCDWPVEIFECLLHFSDW